MAPTERGVEWQTSQIIDYLLRDDAQSRCLLDCSGDIEHDGPGNSDDGFDASAIADKLRSVADALNDDVRFKAALTDMKKAAATQAAEAVFSKSVVALCQAPVPQSAEVASDIQLIKVSVALGLYIIKSSPELKQTVQDAMAAFLNRRVSKQGGWDKVKI
ncbi:uncharacterized protein AB9X84_010385 [Acanthopagrus schlegelii]